MKSSLLCLTLAAALFGCKDHASKLDGMSSAKAVEGSTDTAEVTPPADLPKDVEGRLARVEKRLDKVIALLEQALPPNEPDPATTYAVRIDEGDPVEGPADAKVTIVEGFEFLCPYCYMVNPTVEQIVKKYPKDVRLVSKYLLIHGQPAIAPGMAACAAAKQGKYTQMKAALWNHIFTMDEGRPHADTTQVAPEAIEKIAQEAGVDVAKMKEDMNSPACTGWLSKSRDAMNPVGANGTPAFFINGRYISGAQPFEVFDKVIQEELAKADKAIADGESPTRYYDDQIVAKGVKKVKGRFED
jgi:protein-disulfide isomerase